jgi:hypothetical protein
MIRQTKGLLGLRRLDGRGAVDDDVLMDVAVLELATSRAPGAPFDPTAPRPVA